MKMRNPKHNAGYRVGRCRYNVLERAFAEEWMKENRQNNLLQMLFMKNGHSLIFRTARAFITARDRFIVATIIQWLGTNVGFSFLERCLKTAGLKVVWENGSEVQGYYAGDYYGDTDASAWQNLVAANSWAFPKPEIVGIYFAVQGRIMKSSAFGADGKGEYQCLSQCLSVSRTTRRYQKMKTLSRHPNSEG